MENAVTSIDGAGDGVGVLQLTDQIVGLVMFVVAELDLGTGDKIQLKLNP
jgi:hypothetical protein